MTDEKYIIFESELGELMMEYVNRPLSPSQYIARSAFGDTIRSRPLAKAKPGDCPDCPILTGDDAKRFTEYINNPPAKSPAALELIRQAHDLAKVPVTDNTISSLISENARIGAELRRMTERADMLSGEHDAQIARAATLAENRKWIDALNTLIATESVKLSQAMVNMVYSYRIAQIIESLRIQEPPE
ncbi:MAG: hypothetical protein WC455_20105 [Dehalococcoidia bacterium]|jgi:hypothetical protein